MKRGGKAAPSGLAFPVRIADPLVVLLRHAALVRAVAAVAVCTGVCGPAHDAGHVGDEAHEHDLRRDAIAFAQFDELDRQFDREFGQQKAKGAMPRFAAPHRR